MDYWRHTNRMEERMSALQRQVMDLNRALTRYKKSETLQRRIGAVEQSTQDLPDMVMQVTQRMFENDQRLSNLEYLVGDVLGKMATKLNEMELAIEYAAGGPLFQQAANDFEKKSKQKVKVEDDSETKT